MNQLIHNECTWSKDCVEVEVEQNVVKLQFFLKFFLIEHVTTQLLRTQTVTPTHTSVSQ